MKHVQFSDETCTEIVGVFLSPQSPEFYLHLGEVEDDDPRLLTRLETFKQGPATQERQWRDRVLAEMIWRRDRHRDQLEIGTETTLNAEQSSQLLVYLQALRDWPQSSAFPDRTARPVAPDFLTLEAGQ